MTEAEEVGAVGEDAEGDTREDRDARDADADAGGGARHVARLEVEDREGLEALFEALQYRKILRTLAPVMFFNHRCQINAKNKQETASLKRFNAPKETQYIQFVLPCVRTCKMYSTVKKAH